MHGAAQARRTGAPEGLRKARPGAAGGGLVAVDREGHDARVPQGDECIDELGRGARRWGAQQADAQAHGGSPSCFASAKPASMASTMAGRRPCHAVQCVGLTITSP